MTVVSLLWSSEYPIASTLTEEQTEATADKVKVGETSESFAGLLTVIPASAGSESERAAEHVTVKFLKSFIGFLCDFEGTDFADSPLAFSQGQVEDIYQM
jgi:hypothetical protein